MRTRTRGLTALTAGGLAASLLVPVTAAGAAPRDPTQRLRDRVTADDVFDHLQAFQDIADANGGTRASGTPGYGASVDYLRRELRQAGYRVQVDRFDFPFFEELAPATLAQTAPTAATFETAVFTYSGSGDVTAAVTAVDVQDPPGATPSSTSGCDVADFAGFPAGTVALVQRGTCDFAVKAANAEAAGAAAVIVFNEGQPGRQELLLGTLGGPGLGIPVVGLSSADGFALARTAGATVRVTTSTVSELRETFNVFAETRSGDDDNVVVAGAHLDSVPEGPGINDNGSGSAALLEVAIEMRRFRTENTVRFAWWGAEELGLLGAEEYVATRTPEELEDIALYLNFDMVGSPNFARFVYDGSDPVAPAGSAAIEDLFVDYFDSQGLTSAPTEFNGRSDYGPFIAVGIPAGGLFTGAEGIKTVEEAALFGGTAGVAYDENYHEAGDTIANVNRTAIDQMSDAVAHAVLTYGLSTAEVDAAVPGTGAGDGVAGGGGHTGHDHGGEER